MRHILKLSVFLSMLAGLASAACSSSNLTTGFQTSGAVYQIYMPEQSCFNGGIVVFAHGYVQPGLALGVPQNELTIGGLSLPATFNQLGYGFAASSFSKNGLAILQGVNDTEDLVVNVLRPRLHPFKIYLIGASEGGLVTVLSAEQLPFLYNGAGAACGPIGSFQGQINYFDDFRVIFDYFFPGAIPGNAIVIPGDVLTNWDSVYVPKITALLNANPSAAAQLIKVMSAAISSDPASVAETVTGALWYNVFGTYDAIATLGGQPYDNHNRIYFGSSNDFLLNSRVERYTAAPAALAALTHYETSGRLGLPLVTLHTLGDPIIPYWHETLYTGKTLVFGTAGLRINLPVNAYGHCNFSATDVLSAFALIVLRDTGANVKPQIESVLPETLRAEFIATSRKHELAAQNQ